MFIFHSDVEEKLTKFDEFSAILTSSKREMFWMQKTITTRHKLILNTWFIGLEDRVMNIYRSHVKN